MFRSVSLVGAARKGRGRRRAAQAPTTLVLGQFTGAGLDGASRDRDPSGAAAAAAKRPEATGEPGVLAEAFPAEGPFERVVVVGLGEKSSFTPGALRSVIASVGRRLAALKATSVEIDLTGPVDAAKADPAHAGEAAGEALGLLSWSRDEFKGSASKAAPREPLAVLPAGEAFAEGFAHGLALAESANAARTLSETPPNVCTPGFVAEQAKRLARSTAGLSCTVYSGSALRENELIGLHTVGQASENEPCLVRLEYTPQRKRRGAKPVVLVGKTITYDSGGLSIKTGGHMRGMKRDMDGGAGVFGAMHAVATLVKPRTPVVALLCCAENAISDEAYRPDDIMLYPNGVTVEVTNTDAEGRLVLADGLAWACKHEKPACVIDMATLTGGVVVALGSNYAGMWCDDDRLRAKLEAAAERSGEKVWRLPLDGDYRDMMRSDVADIWNSAPVRAAHAIQGAAFLSYFVEEGTPWCHLDIAGVHAVEGEKGPFVKNSATGFGVRLLAHLIESY